MQALDLNAGRGRWKLKDGSDGYTRMMIRRDMPEVLGIETNGQLAFPWDEDAFLMALRQRQVLGMIAEGQWTHYPVLGFMVYGLHRSSIEVLNFCVHPDHRRMMVGKAMIEKLKSKLVAHKRLRLIFNVRETNLPAQLFLKAQGFEAVRVDRNYFQDEGAEELHCEDGIRFVYRVQE